MLPGKPRVKPGGLHGAGEQVATRWRVHVLVGEASLAFLTPGIQENHHGPTQRGLKREADPEFLKSVKTLETGYGEKNLLSGKIPVIFHAVIRRSQ